jgi:serine protease Do
MIRAVHAVLIAVIGLCLVDRPGARADTPGSFAPLADQALPAVVTVMATTGGGRGSGSSGDGGPGAENQPGPGGPEDFLEDLLRRFGQNPPARPPRGRSLGSGFIVDKAGHIVTNNHVVDGASEVRVTLHDDRELMAKVVGTDPQTDIAVLKIDAANLPTLSWGNSDEATVGQWVLAVGNPFGLGGTITAGIISARARDIGAGPYDDFLQTDAAINMGNSGGPLLNMRGEVVGINTAIFSRSGGNIGIGFAVPSLTAQRVVAELIQSGTVVRGFLGVSIQMLTKDIADAMGVPERHGVLVASVSPKGPAAGAGIEPGDVILSFNGKAVATPRDLSRTVAATRPGAKATVELLRGGKTRTVTAEVAKLEPRQAGAATEQEEAAPSGPLGLALAPLSDATRERFQLPPDLKGGAVVMAVRPDSPAAERGVQPGDVIRRADQTEITRPEDVAQAVEQARSAKRPSILVLLQRQNSALFVPLPLGEAPG